MAASIGIIGVTQHSIFYLTKLSDYICVKY